MRSDENNDALSKLSYMAIITIHHICVIVYTLSNISVTDVTDI